MLPASGEHLPSKITLQKIEEREAPQKKEVAIFGMEFKKKESLVPSRAKLSELLNETIKALNISCVTWANYKNYFGCCKWILLLVRAVILVLQKCCELVEHRKDYFKASKEARLRFRLLTALSPLIYFNVNNVSAYAMVCTHAGLTGGTALHCSFD